MAWVGLDTASAAALSQEAHLRPPDAWKMLDSYPTHYVVNKLGAGEKLVIDGKLDDAAWASTAWTSTGFVDITNHTEEPAYNVVPDQFQTRAKVRWDADYLYIGAELREQYVYGTITGHNLVAPYHDNDFEVFIDVSGTGQYYKEYEMNALNATYDILWGVADGDGLRCSTNNTTPGQPLPVCVNTSFPGYSGTWTMAPALRTATSYNSDDFGVYRYPYTTWTLEIAFPIRAGPDHGGLLSADPVTDFSPFDPSRQNPGPGDPPLYWWLDFARAEHPRLYTNAGASTGQAALGSPSDAGAAVQVCPQDCTPGLGGPGWNASRSNPTSAQCGMVQKKWPTLLGVDPWSCYWEWVWQDLGTQAYMHRPTKWGQLQFAPAETTPICKNIEHPGRHVADQLFLAQQAYHTVNKRYATDARDLATRAVCPPPGCDLHALATALASPDVFALKITVVESIPTLTRLCSARPCYVADVTVSVPSSAGAANSTRAPLAHTYTVTTNDNRLQRVAHTAGGARSAARSSEQPLCL